MDDPAGNTRDIQYTLNFMGYPLTWDNVWGTYTTNAVEHFQDYNGDSADGIVGSASYFRLSWDNH